MTNLARLKVSLTKHGAHKVADLIEAFPRSQVLNNTWDSYQGIKIDQAQTRSNLSIHSDGTLPEIWDEVRQLSDEHVEDLVLLAIIFNHHDLIETMTTASTGVKRGTVERGGVISGKAFTNFACILEELGFSITHNSLRVSYGLSRIFNKFELIPLIVQLLTLKLRKAGWDGSNDFIDECIALNFHGVFGVTEEYFRNWLQRGIIEEIIEQEEQEEEPEEDPEVSPFDFQSGHVEKSEGDVVLNNAGKRLKATLLHNSSV